MLNWNTDASAFKKRSLEKFTIWKLSQQINYGLWGGEKISLSDLKQYQKEVSERVDDVGKTLIGFLIC